MSLLIFITEPKSWGFSPIQSSFTGFFIPLRFIQNDVCEISYIEV